MSSFDLTPQSFVPPSDNHALRVGFTTTAPGNDPLFPATYLQVSYKFGSAQEIFGEVFTARDVVRADGPDGESGSGSGSGVYHVGVPAAAVPVAVVARREDLDVEVSLHAWREHKYLNSWVVGEIKEWGRMRA